jgi:hypothetical protein
MIRSPVSRRFLQAGGTTKQAGVEQIWSSPGEVAIIDRPIDTHPAKNRTWIKGRVLRPSLFRDRSYCLTNSELFGEPIGTLIALLALGWMMH